MGIGIVDLCRGIVGVSEVAATSPLEGLVFPGEHIQLDRSAASSRWPSSAVSDAPTLSAAIFAASQLTLIVETPPSLTGSRSIYLHDDEFGRDAELGIEIEKDRASGRARITGLRPGSRAARAVGDDALSPGDLIVAVSAGGTLYETADFGQAASRLKLHHGSFIELRIVRRHATTKKTSS